MPDEPAVYASNQQGLTQDFRPLSTLNHFLISIK